MSKYLKAGLALSGIILFGAGCAKYSQPPASSTSTSGEEAAAPAGQIMPEAVVEYKDGVFNPSTLRVLVGTKVTFVNKGAKQVWPASGRHPAHDICSGFDALKGIKQGETYSFVFERASECPFHNHLVPAEKGTIEVKAE